MASDDPKVVVYTTEPCAYCRQAKSLLATRGIEYEEINLARDPRGRSDLHARTGRMTFPQIVIRGASIGGFQELLRADKAGALQEMLADAA
jgi:glutaredoxin 3